MEAMVEVAGGVVGADKRRGHADILRKGCVDVRCIFCLVDQERAPTGDSW
jgi:hypothetical protein